MARTKKVEPILENNNIQKIDVVDQPANVDNIVAKSKRGRKPKNPLLNTNETAVENIIVTQNDVPDDKTENIILSNSEELNLNIDNETIHETANENENETDIQVKPIGKKRGRKPKGGKIIQNIVPVTNFKENKPNIILHLKCSMKDLQNNLIENNINGYDLSSYKKDFLYEIISNNDSNTTHNYESSVNNNNSLKCPICINPWITVKLHNTEPTG
jgi:arsenate reductase-like glutaredoxin family protein